MPQVIAATFRRMPRSAGKAGLATHRPERSAALSNKARS